MSGFFFGRYLVPVLPRSIRTSIWKQGRAIRSIFCSTAILLDYSFFLSQKDAAAIPNAVTKSQIVKNHNIVKKFAF